MQHLQFEWDEEKNLRNQRKHGVSFEQARYVFYDEYARFKADPDHSDEEDRFLLLGMDQELRLLVVCHCERSDQVIRIISARKAKKPETVFYRRRNL